MTDEILKYEGLIGSRFLKWYGDRPALNVYTNKPLQLSVSADKKDVSIYNYSPFDFEDVKVCLVKGDDVMPIYSFKDMGNKIEAFNRCNLSVPEKTYNLLKKTFLDKESKYELIVEDVLYKELAKTSSSTEIVSFPNTFKVNIRVPEWVWNDGRLLWAWAFGAKDKEDKWLNCAKVSASEISVDVESGCTGIVLVRGNTSKVGWGWNVGTIDNQTVDFDLRQKGCYFETEDYEWRKY